MRTDTATFRANTFKTLRREGLSSVKAKAVTQQIVTDMRLRGNPTLPADAFLMIDIRSVEEQRVAIVSQHLVIWCLETWQVRAPQPLVDCAPTARQLEIQAILRDGIADLYAAQDRGDDSVKARYDALVAESLAINPRVEASVSDPEQASFWYEWVHEVRGYRPDGFMTLAMVRHDMERLKTERPFEEMDDREFGAEA